MNGTRWQWRIMKWERNLKAVLQGSPVSSNWTVSKIIIYTNVFLFALMVAQGIGGGLGLTPIMNPGGFLLIHSGAQYWPLVFAEGE